MREGFENWKDKLDEADAEELVPGFAADATWQQLQPRLTKKQPVKWWLYAAAMLAGLLLGGSMMNVWNTRRTNIEPNVVTVEKRSATVTQTITVHDTVYRTVPLTNKTSTAVAKVPDRKIKLQPAPEPIQHIQSETIVTQQEVQATRQEEAIVALPAPKQRVLHMMDIENEDKKMMLTAPAEPQRAPIVSIFSPNAVRGNTENTRRSVVEISLKKQ